MSSFALGPTYSIIMRGEDDRRFRVEGWRGISATETADVLASVTGYRASYLRKELTRAIRRSPRGEWRVSPAACAWGETPSFIVTRDDRRAG